MSAYLSIDFEKDLLPNTDQVRVIVRNRDEGSVPPKPSVSYYPTDPNSLQDFLVIDYVNSTVGESFKRVATLADLGTYSKLTLNTFYSASADFVTANVLAGDTLELALLEDELWQSDEYPSGNTFTFQIASIVNANTLTIATYFPGFQNSLTWAVPARSINGSDGTTLRQGSPSAGTTLLDARFNAYFTTAVSANNFIASTKADVAGLLDEVIGDGFTDESVTIEPTI